MIKPIGGELWQWDTGRTVEVRAKPGCTVDEVHFFNGTTETALIGVVENVDGVVEANIPNIFLQSANNLVVYSVMVDPDGERTTERATFAVNKREKPDDYVYTETELLAWANFDERIKVLEKGVKYIESNKTDKVCLRDLETGIYILYGYFKPFPGSNSTIIIDNLLMHVYTGDKYTYMSCITADGIVNVYEILVDETNSYGYTYSRYRYKLDEIATNAGSVKYVESMDENNIKNLLDLETGVYKLYGYFHPFPGSPFTMTIDNRLVTVEKQDEGSHFYIHNTRNGKIRFVEVLVDESNTYGYTEEIIDIDLREINHAVLFGSAQSLTDEEKAQVRQNIGGVVTETAMSEALQEVEGKLQSDWDAFDPAMFGYVKNRTHYKEYMIDSDSYAEETLTAGTTYKCDSNVHNSANIEDGATFFAFIDGEPVYTTPINGHTGFQNAIKVVFGMISTSISTTQPKADRKTGKYALNITCTVERDCTIRYGYAYPSGVKTLDEIYLPFKSAATVADAAGSTPTATEFNALLASLRAAGLLKTE